MLHQNGAGYYGASDGDAQHDDVASAGTAAITDDDYADSASEPRASHGMPVHSGRMQSAHSAHYAPAAQSSHYVDERTGSPSQGKR